MYPRREVTSSSGFLPLLPVSPTPPVTSTKHSPSAPKTFDEPFDGEHFAVYGIKIWRWKISVQIPRRYTKVSQNDDLEEKEIKNKGQISKNLKVNQDFFRQIDNEAGILNKIYWTYNKCEGDQWFSVTCST